MHLSASQLSTFQECQRKWYFSYVIQRIKPSTDAMFKGSLFHKIFELYYKDGYSYDDLVSYCREKASHKPSIMSAVLLAFKSYTKKYPDRASQIVLDSKDTPMCEVGFSLQYDNEIEVIGYVDYMLQKSVKSYVTDIKVTSMSLTDWYFQGFELSYQTMLYSYVCAKLFPDIGGFMIDGIQIKQNKNDVKVAFAMQFFPLSINIASFESELHAIAMHISKYKDSGKEYFPHNYTSCVTKYGRCAYHNICTMPEDVQEEYLLADDSYVPKGSRAQDEEQARPKIISTSTINI